MEKGDRVYFLPQFLSIKIKSNFDKSISFFHLLQNGAAYLKKISLHSKKCCLSEVRFFAVLCPEGRTRPDILFLKSAAYPDISNKFFGPALWGISQYIERISLSRSYATFCKFEFVTTRFY